MENATGQRIKQGLQTLRLSSQSHYVYHVKTNSWSGQPSLQVSMSIVQLNLYLLSLFIYIIVIEIDSSLFTLSCPFELSFSQIEFFECWMLQTWFNKKNDITWRKNIQKRNLKAFSLAHSSESIDPSKMIRMLTCHRY